MLIKKVASISIALIITACGGVSKNDNDQDNNRSVTLFAGETTYRLYYDTAMDTAEEQTVGRFYCETLRFSNGEIYRSAPSHENVDECGEVSEVMATITEVLKDGNGYLIALEDGSTLNLALETEDANEQIVTVSTEDSQETWLLYLDKLQAEEKLAQLNALLSTGTSEDSEGCLFELMVERGEDVFMVEFNVCDGELF